MGIWGPLQPGQGSCPCGGAHSIRPAGITAAGVDAPVPAIGPTFSVLLSPQATSGDDACIVYFSFKTKDADA